MISHNSTATTQRECQKKRSDSFFLIDVDHIWMAMIESRNKTTHTYNETTARDIANDVRARFYPAFCALEKTLLGRLDY